MQKLTDTEYARAVERLGTRHEQLPPLAAMVAKELDYLGDTPEQIAGALQEMGIRGDDTPDGHPLASFVTRMRRREVFCAVCDGTHVSIQHRERDDTVVELNKVAREFCRRFAAGLYPEISDGMWG